MKSKFAILLAFAVCILPVSARSQFWEWIPASGPSTISGIAVAPNGDYVISGYDLLCYSTDRGVSWKANRTGYFGTTRYDATYHIRGPILFTKAGMLVDGYLTTDYGAHWIHKPNAPFGEQIVSDPMGTYLYGILTDPDPRIVFSNDGGLTWSGFVSANQMDSIATLLGVTNDNVLFADGIGTGLIRFENGTRTTVLSQIPQGPFFEISAGVLILFKTDQDHLGRSYDNGKSWVQDTSIMTLNAIHQVRSGIFRAANSNDVLLSNDTGHTFRNAIPVPYYGQFMIAGDSSYDGTLFTNGNDVQAFGPYPNYHAILSSAFSTTELRRFEIWNSLRNRWWNGTIYYGIIAIER